MKKYRLPKEMVEPIEFLRSLHGDISLYAIVNGVNLYETPNEEFNRHARKIDSHFNNFDNKTDDVNFMKCLLGHYVVVDN